MSFISEKEFHCPYCGTSNAVNLDEAQGRKYELVTDCETCCRPIVVQVKLVDDDFELDVHAENE